MKAIHNHKYNEHCAYCTVFNISKIQNESNSQQFKKICLLFCHCVQYFKDTK